MNNGIRYALCFVLIAIYTCYSSVEVYFSPQDHIKTKLITRIRNEKTAIKAALYLILDKEVVKELVKAHKRGVKVELIVDHGNLDSEWNKIPMLYDGGITVYVYTSNQGILHDKFFIFERNQDNKPALWTGSFNITRSADKYNRENVVVVDDRDAIQHFSHEFDRLKKASAPYRASYIRSPFKGPSMVINNTMGKKLSESPRI